MKKITKIDIKNPKETVKVTMPATKDNYRAVITINLDKIELKYWPDDEKE